MDPSVKQVAIAYLGVQLPGYRCPDDGTSAILRLKELAAQVGGPPHHDVAYSKDGADFDTLVFIAYWSDPIELERWLALPELMQWWAGEDRVNDGVGMVPRDHLSRDRPFRNTVLHRRLFRGCRRVGEGHERRDSGARLLGRHAGPLPDLAG